MNQYDETFETWNKVAALYQAKFMHLEIYNESYDFICNALPLINSTILEIGCGPANISKYLLSKRTDFIIQGIDVAPNMIELAKENNPTAHFEVMDARLIHQLKVKYDGIIIGFCLPYLSPNDTTKLIYDSSNLLKDNGLLYVSFVEGDPKNSGFKAASTGERSYFYYHNLEQIKTELMKHSFSDFTLFKVNYKRNETEIHTILIARKNST
jgi:2-polyprenyl-3-methyl-5-hydroxy-6-metoxy-1,4-benzoquinol methylase